MPQAPGSVQSGFGGISPSMRRPVVVKGKFFKRSSHDQSLEGDQREPHGTLAVPAQSLPFPLLRELFASLTGPVKAERSEPQGSLDGWQRCRRWNWREWQAFWPLFVLSIDSRLSVSDRLCRHPSIRTICELYALCQLAFSFQWVLQPVNRSPFRPAMASRNAIRSNPAVTRTRRFPSPFLLMKGSHVTSCRFSSPWPLTVAQRLVNLAAYPQPM
jgi:hypothetical protein